ncbi:aminodeoxychorismate synthase component I [Microbispora triticiradicis]|uniref:aminodeoxychorismate synthase n=2 Tax=Microbispora TaxID=2005 RepID=A0ABY3LNB7_9ACTN|nr:MULTISPECIES: aminodeoxychorismate synthase component I [Microbispora]TLP55763.1 aminodeoxychorismate synthase component I [Microbispora fusca]TYB44369.1 aminodeoxychorismate synthase component I [Microbispora tritici]
MRTLLIDNHDSYTYNLFQLMARVYGTEPTVVTNDDAAWPGLDIEEFDAIVVSPGPGHPGRDRDLGAVRQVVARTRVPLLGVCLGHQAIALLSGADVVPAPRPRHGHLTRVRHTGEDLFQGLPQDFQAVRYHSLCVPEEGLPDTLTPTAWAEDGVLMGLRHRERPLWGVQFHPESIATEHGAQLVENFGRLAAKALAEQGRSLRPARAPRRVSVQPAPLAPEAPPAAVRPWRLLHRVVPYEVDTAAAFTDLFGGLEHAFWLDSSRVEPGLSRFSFLGAPEGRDGEILSYSVGEGLTIRSGPDPETVTWPDSIFDALRTRLAEPVLDVPDVPFDLTSGYVGYFGYELRAELGSPCRHRAATPDAVWLSATRLVVVDHEQRTTHLIALTRSPDDPAASSWLARAERRLARWRPPPGADAPAAGGHDPEPGLLRARDGYLDDVEACRGKLREGESYEICLTTQTRLPVTGDPLELYLAQRASNPAPYAAFLRLGGFAVLCSSPERFLRIRPDRTVETKPIKGTAARGRGRREDLRLRARLTTDPKVRAENLMIVDLLRNDLGRVCEVGSVHVPSYMAVETYATVHQLVSTIQGTLRPDVDAIGCVTACFPGGSMTGAPKLRTMEILDEMEQTARGVYSGAIGFLGHNGTADLNIVIRTAVATAEGLTVGAGGAIVLDSDPAEEFEEMLLKARAPLRVAGPPLSASEPGLRWAEAAR